MPELSWSVLFRIDDLEKKVLELEQKLSKLDSKSLPMENQMDTQMNKLLIDGIEVEINSVKYKVIRQNYLVETFEGCSVFKDDKQIGVVYHITKEDQKLHLDPDLRFLIAYCISNLLMSDLSICCRMMNIKEYQYRDSKWYSI